MMYRFKSQAAADLLMLQANGDQLLTLIGKELTPQGIVTVDQTPAALAALETAIEAHEAAQAHRPENLPLANDIAEGNVPLRHRAAPFVDLLKCSMKAGKDVVWGV